MFNAKYNLNGILIYKKKKKIKTHQLNQMRLFLPQCGISDENRCRNRTS